METTYHFVNTMNAPKRLYNSAIWSKKMIESTNCTIIVELQQSTCIIGTKQSDFQSEGKVFKSQSTMRSNLLHPTQLWTNAYDS